MIPYCLTIGAAGSALWITNLQQNPLMSEPQFDGTTHPILLCVIPALGAWLGCMLTRYRVTRRVLRPGLRNVSAPIAWGIAVWILSLAMAMAGVRWLDDRLPDGAIMFLSAFAATAALLYFSPRFVPGHCRQCDYDLRASLQSGRCPECGNAI